MLRLGLCAIFKNEKPYIIEWLTYHYIIGFRTFILYDNNSTDGTVDAINEWPYRDIVKVISWNHIGGQIKAYEDMLLRHRADLDWIAFIDCDEFIVMQTEDKLSDFLETLPKTVTGLFMHWLYFGSSGHKEIKPGLVVERFCRRGDDSFYTHHCGKTMIRADQARGWAGIHIIPSNGMLVNDSFDEIDQKSSGHTKFISHRKIALNHYFTKSKTEWTIRRSMGKADKKPDELDFKRTDEEFDNHDRNEFEDLKASKYADAIRNIAGHSLK